MDDKYNNIDPIYTNEPSQSSESTNEFGTYKPAESNNEFRTYKPAESNNEFRTYKPINDAQIIEPEYREEELYGNTSEETQDNYYREAPSNSNPTTTPQTTVKPPRKKKPSRGVKFFRRIAVFLVFVFLGGIIFGAGYSTAIYLGNQLTPELIDREPSYTLDVNKIETVVSTETSTSTVNSVTDIAKTAGPSVVTVTSTFSYNYNSIWGQQVSEGVGTGSGIIYDLNDDQVLFITNHHVIEDAESVEVTLHDGATVAANIVGYNSRMDLAVLSVSLEELNSSGIHDITVATFGDSDSLEVGELAVAIGNPLGKEYSSTVTAGVISALDRELVIDNTPLALLQTDAAINPGNSGGALVNGSGEVIGVNTAKYVDESVEGMGFSIPINSALPIIEDIIELSTGSDIAYELTDDKPFLGVSISNITDAIYEETGMPFGIYVAEVYQGSAAQAAGIQAGDVIYSVDGQRLIDSDDLFDVLASKSVGDTITVSVSRGDANLDLEATLTRYADVVN